MLNIDNSVFFVDLARFEHLQLKDKTFITSLAKWLNQSETPCVFESNPLTRRFLLSSMTIPVMQPETRLKGTQLTSFLQTKSLP